MLHRHIDTLRHSGVVISVDVPDVEVLFEEATLRRNLECPKVCTRPRSEYIRDPSDAVQSLWLVTPMPVKHLAFSAGCRCDSKDNTKQKIVFSTGHITTQG